MSNISVKEFLSKNESFGLFTKSVDSVSKAYSIIGLCLLLKDMGKQVKLVLSEMPTGRVKRLLSRKDIERVDDVRASSYVISIDYSKGNIDKVSYDKDEKTGKVNIHIFPKDSSFDFDNIEYKEGGTDFDAVIAYDLESLEEMGDIYSQNKKLFSAEKIFSIGMKFKFGNHQPTELNYINVDFGDTYTGSLLKMLTHEYRDLQMNSAVAQVFMNGLVYESNLIEGSPMIDNVIDLLGFLRKNGASFAQATKKVYFSRTLDFTLIKNRLVENVEIDDDDRVAWSKVSFGEISQISDEPEKLFDVTKTRLPFHESKDIDLSIGAIELKEGEITVLVQSSIPDEISASSIVESFHGQGDDASASCVLKDVNIDDFEKVFLSVVNDICGKDINFEEDDSEEEDSVDNVDEDTKNFAEDESVSNDIEGQEDSQSSVEDIFNDAEK